MKKQASDMGRRQLLKALALGGAAGAVVTVSSQALAASPTTSPAAPKNENYRETEHVRQYYASLNN
ncbi:MAG: twin-arginine translocation signal domain-containing protein [Shewanella sp.]